MSYTPSEKILKKYADVMVNFALGMGKGIKKGDVVRLSANESTSRYFYQHASESQIKFFPKKYLKGVVDEMDHSLFILADKDMHLMDGIDPKKIMARGVAMKPFMDWRHEKEWKGKMS